MCVFRIPGPGGAVRDNDRDEVIDRPTVSVCMCASQSRHGDRDWDSRESVLID
jgi:hypothetical protein